MAQKKTTPKPKTTKAKAAPAKTPPAKKKATPKRRTTASKAKATAKKAPATNGGETITKTFKGQKITVKITDEGFVCRGKTWKSLTALALHITGYKAVSGPAFFGLTKASKKGGTA